MSHLFQPQLKELRSKNAPARAILNLFGQKESGQREITLHRAYIDSAGVNKAQATKALKQIAHIGYGRFIVGRKGNESRFVGNRDLSSIYELSLNEGEKATTSEPAVSTTLLASDPSLEDVTSNEGLAPSSPPSKRMLDHVFHLRPTLDIRLTLPEDLSQSEASRLATFVQSLPF